MSVSMQSLRAEFSPFFARDLASDFAALSDKDTARANLARSITGCAIQWAHSGNDAHIKFLETLPKKGVNAARCRAAIGLITSKPRAMAKSTMADFETFSEDTFLTIHAVLTPPPKAAPTIKAPTIKAPALNDILMAINAGLYSPEDMAALQTALQTAPAPALQTALQTAPALL